MRLGAIVGSGATARRQLIPSISKASCKQRHPLGIAPIPPTLDLNPIPQMSGPNFWVNKLLERGAPVGPLDGREQNVEIDRLDEKIVHSRRTAALKVATRHVRR